jgi:hypothetical protein
LFRDLQMAELLQPSSQNSGAVSRRHRLGFLALDYHQQKISRSLHSEDLHANNFDYGESKLLCRSALELRWEDHRWPDLLDRLAALHCRSEKIPHLLHSENFPANHCDYSEGKILCSGER